MDIPREVIMALKAFQIGSSASLSPNRIVALSMIDTAIVQLRQGRHEEGILQLTFYLGVRAEFLREIGDPLPDRLEIKELCEGLGSSFFKWYMAVQEVTLSRPHYASNGSTSAYALGGGTNDDADNAYVSPYGRTRRALEKLNLENKRLSDSQKRFLKDVTLTEILVKHGIKLPS